MSPLQFPFLCATYRIFKSPWETRALCKLCFNLFSSTVSILQSLQGLGKEGKECSSSPFSQKAEGPLCLTYKENKSTQGPNQIKHHPNKANFSVNSETQGLEWKTLRSCHCHPSISSTQASRTQTDSSVPVVLPSRSGAAPGWFTPALSVPMQINLVFCSRCLGKSREGELTSFK